ncbi:von Willebrand factor D and EGF domain-containing protein-like isoform X3 [Mytilus edulis]|uniref:von Willebrand factor D and EGF domain-containing protein-like isoform X3 n=1 Tax=Mytilus edulis TaxID=6550 RepID=UPI0039F03326
MRILFYYICIFNVGKSVANSGSADVCADGQSSETGMAPGCSDNYPHVVLTPKVVTDLADGIQIRKFTTLEPVFKCVFDEMIDSLKLVFDIHWYINNDLVVVNMNIAQGKLFDTHMRPHHWTTTYSMNMQVKCSVRARLGPNETPSPFFESEEITAGVISDLHLNSFVEVTEGKAATIKLRSTVPVGCFSKNRQSQCNHTMHIRQISYNYNSNRCINNLQTGDLAIETEFCGITIPSIGWDNTLDLKVTGYVNNLYDEQKTRTATIHFTSLVRNNVDISGTWNRVDIPDLKVRITDADHKLSGRACLAFTLSNFVTIYGDEYSFQGAGEYVLYRHKTLPYSVHILQTAIKSSSTGICGIAVRSVNSIFVLRTCNTISQYFSNQNVLTVPVVQYKQCNDNDMTIQETGSGYKIHLPSGTEITFQYERYWIKSILVKPSVLDDGLVNGLCGNIANKESISTSWRVSNALQQLFIEKPQHQTAFRPPQQYCTCKKEAGPTDDPSILKFEFVQCDLSQPIDVYSCQHPNQVNEYIIDECTLSRNRRSVVNRNIPTLDDIKEVIPLTYDSSFDPNYIPQEPSWPEMWSKYQAQVFCENYTSSMEIVRLCRQYSSFNVDTFTEGCMKDIKHGGNTNYVEWIVGVIKDYCFVELSRNATSMSRTTENGKTLYYELLYTFCPTGCRHWRNCVNGKCIECDSNDFIGHDCLALKSEPPKDIVLAGNGSCNTRQRPCLKTDIYGEFKSTLLYCKLSRFKITVNGIVQNETSNIWPGEYNSAHSISCQFPRQPRNRPTTELAVGYIISIAYDREHFGDNVSIVIYDGTCVTCEVSTLTCNVLKPYEECMPTSSTWKPFNQRTTHRSSATEKIQILKQLQTMAT